MSADLPPTEEGDVVWCRVFWGLPSSPLCQAQKGQHAGPSGQPEEDLGPGLSVLGGLFLLFMLENVLQRRGLRPVSDSLFSSFCQDQSPSQELATGARR